MREVEANKRAWSLLARDHYEHFRHRLAREENLLNSAIRRELGDVAGKSVIHLQCNTGADTICLARMGAAVTGVDLVPENVSYARKLAAEFGVENAEFLACDIMDLMEHHDRRYDVVFTSEGAIGWMPDLEKWGRTIRHLLEDDGVFYAFDSHPFALCFDEAKLRSGELQIAYPYFSKTPDADSHIGGYASEPREGQNYFWMYTIGDVINSLTRAGLSIEFFNEHDELYFDMGGMEPLGDGFYRYPELEGKLPFSFSLRATVRAGRS